MKFGLGITTGSEGYYHPIPFADHRQLLQITRLAESQGYDYVWTTDHIIMPESSRRPGDQRPRIYEILVFMAYMAAVTQRLRLASGVIQPPLREPVLLAKQVSTLDVISNGRMVLGVGLGNDRAEFKAISPRLAGAHRGRMLDESLEALKLLLNQDEASFTGEYYQFQGVSLSPRPLQQPFPIYLAGNHPGIPERVAKWCTGWLMSVSTSRETISDRVERFLPLLEKEGRDLAEIDLAAVAVQSIARTHKQAVERFRGARVVSRARGQDIEDFARRNFIGTPAEVIERVHELQKQGATQCMVSNHAVDTFDELVEQVRWFGEEVIPAFSGKELP